MVLTKLQNWPIISAIRFQILGGNMHKFFKKIARILLLSAFGMSMITSVINSLTLADTHPVMFVFGTFFSITFLVYCQVRPETRTKYGLDRFLGSAAAIYNGATIGCLFYIHKHPLPIEINNTRNLSILLVATLISVGVVSLWASFKAFALTKNQESQKITGGSY